MGEVEKYIHDCLTGVDTYSGERLRSLIEAFGHVLREHLSEEIDTLEDLRIYGDEKMKTLPDVFQAMVQHETVSLSL
jgi:hypothetical protein